MTNIKRYVMAVYTNFGADGHGEAGWHECQYINAASEEEAREIATRRVIEQSEPGTVVEVVIVAAVVDADDPCIYDIYGAIQRWIEETKTESETNTETETESENNTETKTETNEKWADLIREHYDEIASEIKNLLWDGYGRVQHDVLIYEDGTVDTVVNIGGNDFHTNAYTVMSTRGMKYATPYDYWDESDWIGAVREVVGQDGMLAFWDRIVKDQNADDFEDYQEHARNGYYDQVSYILTHNAAFDNIMNEIANNWKNDTESDRIRSAETIIDDVLDRLEGRF